MDDSLNKKIDVKVSVSRDRRGFELPESRRVCKENEAPHAMTRTFFHSTDLHAGDYVTMERGRM